MAQRIEFTVYGEPKGKMRPRYDTRNARTYTPTATKNAEEEVRKAYLEQVVPLRRVPDKAPVRMTLTVYHGIAKSDNKAKRAAKMCGSIRPTKRPDVDNVMKLVSDALNTVAYADDSQIVECSVTRWYSDTPRLEVVIEEIGEGSG